MRTFWSKKRLIFVTGTLLLGAGLVGAQMASNFKETNDIAVVVNAKNEINGLSMADLRKLLLGEHKFWKNKMPVLMVLRQPGTRERDEVLSIAARMADHD